MNISLLLPVLAAPIAKELAWAPYIALGVFLTVFLGAVQILHIKARNAFDAGQWDKALKYYEYTWWLFGVSTKKDVRPLFDFNLAKINAARSRPQRAIELYLRSRRLAIEVDNPLIIAMSSIEIGRLYAKLEDWDHAINAYQEAKELAEKHPKKPYLIKILMAMADAHAEHEDDKGNREYEAAELLLQEARKIADVRQDLSSSINIWVALGKLAYDQGNWVKARELLDAALEKTKERRTAGRAGSLAYVWSGRLYAQQGYWDEARRDLREAIKISRQLKDKGATFAATLELGRLTRDMGHPDQALEQLEQALKWAKELKDPRRQAMALEAIGTTYLAANQPQLAFLNFKKATVLLKTNYLPRVEALVLAGLAAYYEERGESSQARQTLHQAEKLAKQGDAVYEMVAIYDAFAAFYARSKKGELSVAYTRKAHALRRKLGVRAALSEMHVETPGR